MMAFTASIDGTTSSLPLFSNKSTYVLKLQLLHSDYCHKPFFLKKKSNTYIFTLFKNVKINKKKHMLLSILRGRCRRKRGWS